MVCSMAAAAPILTRPVAARSALAGDFEAVLGLVRSDGALRRVRDLTMGRGGALGRWEGLYSNVDVAKDLPREEFWEVGGSDARHYLRERLV